jgi:hypothetical protein
VRLVLEELVHFLRDAQVQSNRYLPHILTSMIRGAQ